VLHLYLLDKSKTGLFFGVFGFVRRYSLLSMYRLGVFFGAGCIASGNVVEGEGADGSGDGPRIGRAREGHWEGLYGATEGFPGVVGCSRASD